jgi:hypothetical protein
MLDGGAATVKDLDLRDGVIDMDVATPAARGFFGIQFRADSANAEFVYLRQHKSGLPDAMQYTPVLNTGLNWQLYSGPGFTGAVDIPRETWFHLRLAIAGARARLTRGACTAAIRPNTAHTPAPRPAYGCEVSGAWAPRSGSSCTIKPAPVVMAASRVRWKAARCPAG